jgi:hypothetical protein
MRSSQVVLDQVDIAFDDERAGASTGLLPATLAERLGDRAGRRAAATASRASTPALGRLTSILGSPSGVSSEGRRRS